MPTYNVVILEDHLYKCTFSVEADSKEEAEQKALMHDGKRVEDDVFKGVSHHQVTECELVE